MRRLWQSVMIGLARSTSATRLMQETRATSRLAQKYVAGKNPADAVNRALMLFENNGIRSSLFYLGEYVDASEKVTENLESKLQVADALAKTHLDLHISVDPTQIGYQLHPSLAEENARTIASKLQRLTKGKDGIHCLMLDMEDASVTDSTIALHDRLKGEGLPVALTLQAYLRRTENDLMAQIEQGSVVRLVKGAFAAGADSAFTSQSEIKENSRRLISMMLSKNAKERGFYPIVATHDTKLQDYAREVAEDNGWQKGEYEFEMLLGVRSEVAQSLAEQGERIRLYLPFGRDWWPYAVRRIGENPRNFALLLRSLFSN